MLLQLHLVSLHRLLFFLFLPPTSHPILNFLPGQHTQHAIEIKRFYRMGKRGPKPKPNMVRKWWRMHRITVAQLDALLLECQDQLPLLACKLDVPLLIAALVAREAKAVEDGLFDANELTEAFKIEDSEEAEEEELETVA